MYTIVLDWEADIEIIIFWTEFIQHLEDSLVQEALTVGAEPQSYPYSFTPTPQATIISTTFPQSITWPEPTVDLLCPTYYWALRLGQNDRPC